MMLDWVAKWADYTPNKVAIVSHETGERYTYLQLHAYADNLRLYFQEIGLEEGDRVAVLAEHGFPMIALFVACQRSGIILVPLNYRLSSSELSEQLEDANAGLFVYSLKQATLANKIENKVAHQISYAELRSYLCYPKRELPVYNILEDNAVFVFYTSGTTGKPKGVMYTNKMLFWNSLNTSMQLGITFRDTTLSVSPPYHTSGWNVFVTPLLHKGAEIGILEKFDAEQVLCLLELNETSLFMVLPTMLQMMERTKIFQTVKMQHLRYVITGGEFIAPEMVARWKLEKNLKIRPGYGLTEAGPSITSLHHDMVLEKPGSIGKPNFYLEIKIIDKNGEIAAPFEVGELCIKGEVVTPGYWNNSVATNEKIKNGWLHTGDFAYADAEGYLFLKGRKSDMYISGGENIYPQEIERVLEMHNLVDRAVVLPKNDKKWGQCGIAFVEVTKESLDAKELRVFIQDKIGAYKMPKYIFVLTELPRTSLGKASRKALMRYFESVSQEPF
ncbi:MAG: AMP-binding protein [Flavobacteriaceae bacterium]|nr:AMP-binding protein [Flavobacteriaceae bacterium]